MMSRKVKVLLVLAVVTVAAAAAVLGVVLSKNSSSSSSNSAVATPGDSSAANASPGSSGSSGNDNAPTPAPGVTTKSLSNRVVAYVPDYGVKAIGIDNIDWSGITHAMVSFLSPNTDGTHFISSKTMNATIKAAHQHGVYAFLSVGGGSAADIWVDLMSAPRRAAVIESIMDMALALDVDGIDIDFEGTMVTNADYNGFATDMIKAAKSAKLQISGAIEKYVVANISTEVLSSYDFISLMAYNYKGPWNTKPPLSMYSSYDVAESELLFYSQNLSIPVENLVLGVPFTGYDFGSPNVTQVTWAQVVAKYPGSVDVDNVDQVYYNGKNTIKSKAILAKDYGGIMIWQLGYDTATDKNNSLLQVIKSVYYNGK